jgi:hypothetical protein
MTSLQLKKNLISRIREIDDAEFLDEIKLMLDSKSKQQILKLTPEQQKDIRESKKEVSKGHIITQADLDKEIQKWSDEK